MEYNKIPNEYTSVPSDYVMPEEFPSPKVSVKKSDDPAGDKTKNRHELIKKLILLPVLAVTVTVTVLFSSMGLDPLGNDFLVNGMGKAAPSTGTTPSGSSGTSPSGGTSTESETTPTPSADDGTPAYTDSFPSLENLNPDFDGKYAWSGMGTEEYLVLDSMYLEAGTYWKNYAGATETKFTGASYDRETNTLTLNNYKGTFIDANLMGNGFKIKLIGENSLEYIKLWGAMYGGSVTFTGDGSLKLNVNKTVPNALYLMCEYSPSCVMVDREATVELFGSDGPALVISDTLLKDALYTLEPIKTEGGEYSSESRTMTDSSTGEQITCYDVTLNDGSEPSEHIIFSPSR